jgi:hypothetical protein
MKRHADGMPTVRRVLAIVSPTVEEDAAITPAALSDPDAQPLTDAQLGALVPIKTLRGGQACMDVAQQARRSS